jgi:hypothetical protein
MGGGITELKNVSKWYFITSFSGFWLDEQGDQILKSYFSKCNFYFLF